MQEKQQPEQAVTLPECVQERLDGGPFFSVGPTRILGVLQNHQQFQEWVFRTFRRDDTFIRQNCLRKGVADQVVTFFFRQLVEALGTPDGYITTQVNGGGHQSMETVLDNFFPRTVESPPIVFTDKNLEGVFRGKWFKELQRKYREGYGEEVASEKVKASANGFPTLEELEASGATHFFCTAVDTSNGKRITAEQWDILRRWKQKDPANRLVFSDITSTIGGEKIPWDVVDVAFAPIQKGLGGEAERGTITLSQHAYKKLLELTPIDVAPHRQLTTVVQEEGRRVLKTNIFYWRGKPTPVNVINTTSFSSLLHSSRVLQLYNQMGAEAGALERSEANHQAVLAGLETEGGKLFANLVDDENSRSRNVTVLKIQDPWFKSLSESKQKEFLDIFYGMSGYGKVALPNGKQLSGFELAIDIHSHHLASEKGLRLWSGPFAGGDKTGADRLFRVVSDVMPKMYQFSRAVFETKERADAGQDVTKDVAAIEAFYAKQRELIGPSCSGWIAQFNKRQTTEIGHAKL